MEPFVQISEEKEHVNQSNAELCWLNWRQETCLPFQGLSKGDLILMHWPVCCHFLPPCLLLPRSASLGCFIPVCQLYMHMLLFCPFCYLSWVLSVFCLGSVRSQVSLQHDTCLLPRSTRTSTFHVGRGSLVDSTGHSRWV